MTATITASAGPGFRHLGLNFRRKATPPDGPKSRWFEWRGEQTGFGRFHRAFHDVTVLWLGFDSNGSLLF
jgi:hypothetical protein